MIKLHKQVDALKAIQIRIHEKIEELEEKAAEIEDTADVNNRDLTKAEERRLDKIADQIEELEEEWEAVGNAIDCLSDYDIL